MRPRRSRCIASLFAALCCLAIAEPSWADWQGKRVSEVLNELRNQGLVFIYNSSVVHDALRVEREPRAADGLELAREVLAPHGLTLLNVGANTYSVVASAQTKQAEPPPEETTLAAVVVTTSRYVYSSQAPGAQALVTQDEVNNLPHLGDETLRAVQRLPGTASNGFSSLGPIRGGAPNETGILLDGMRLFEPFHLKNFLSPISVLDARLVAGMDIFLGGFPARYGDRMSGMIDARTVRPTQSRYYELGLSVFHLNGLASLDFADGAGSGLVSARRSNLSELAELSENDVGEPSYSDGFARLEYAFGERTRGTISVLLSRDKINALDKQGTQRSHAEYRNNYVWATWVRDWTERASTQVLAGFTDVTNERDGQLDEPGRRSGVVKDLRSFQVANLRVDTTLRGDLLEQQLGVEMRELRAQYDYASTVNFAADFPFPGQPARQVTRQVAPQPDGDEWMAYWDGQAKLGERWTAQIGLRVDNQTEYGVKHATQWSPRLSVLYVPAEATKLRASWGRFFQAQGINELQVEDGVDNFFPSQRADHLIANIEQTLSASVVLRVEAYRKDYERLYPRYENAFDPVVLIPELEYDRIQIAPLRARAEGVDLLLSWQPEGAWGGWFGYSWSQVRDRVAGDPERDVPRSWDQTHAVSAGLSWSRGPWTATLADIYHTGWPTTRIELTPQPAIGPRNSARYSAFNSLDLRATRTFKLTRGELDVFLEISNATARNNACCTQYTLTQDANGVTVLNEKTDYWLSITPSAGVLWRYGK